MLLKLLQLVPMNEFAKMPNHDNKIMLEMSGGIDSGVSALLLKDQGFDVCGVMMKLHDSKNLNSEIESAKQICKFLDISFELVDLEENFKNNVVNYFINTYNDAKTPNPCIVCNKKMKFGEMFNLADKLDCNYIATGHYAIIDDDDGKFELYRARDLGKDQSYVLHFLDQKQLSKIKFPLGNYTKDQVKQLAKDAKLPCFDKEESMDICFIEDGDYVNFIKQHKPNYSSMPGNVVDTHGNILGKHNGLINYTIGQRKGLGIALSKPMYVLSLNKEKNEVVLGTKEENYQNTVSVSDFS